MAVFFFIIVYNLGDGRMTLLPFYEIWKSPWRDMSKVAQQQQLIKGCLLLN